jgi:hypothetical protein
MPLSLFDHNRLTHYRSTTSASNTYDHTFGGDPKSYGLRFVNVDKPMHLMYRLDLSDPSLPIQLDGIKHLPLIYGFHYAAYDGTLIYRVLNDVEIEVLAPEELTYDPDFPYPGHPDQFPFTRVGFTRLPFDATVAEDAMSLQAIFGLDKLSDSELARAIKIGLSNKSYVCYSRDNVLDPTSTDEDIVRFCGRAPFMQGAPCKSCKNPGCTAEIAYHVEEEEIEFPPEFAEMLGGTTLRMDARDVRVDTMRVFAIYEPDADDELVWGDPFIQLVFEFCDCCHCIRVTNQCT